VGNFEKKITVSIIYLYNVPEKNHASSKQPLAKQKFTVIQGADESMLHRGKNIMHVVHIHAS